MEQRPETAGHMADEDRAYTARMLGGCGWIALGILTVLIAAVVAGAVAS